MRQESILYVPCVMPGVQKPGDNPEGMRSPADRGLTYEDVVLKTSDGLRIHGWFITCGDGYEKAPTILFCHANAGNIGIRIPNYAQIVEKLRANIFALDYRGYGHSDGTPSEEGLIEDALSAWRWLRTAGEAGRFDCDRIFVFGRSLGGAVAVALARELRRRGEAAPCGVILENTFVSVSALVDAMFPFIAFKSLKDRFLRLRWETAERIGDLEVPLLILSGEKDEMIPPWHSRVLHQRAEKSPLKRCVAFPEGTHNDTWEKGGDKYWEAQDAFLKESSARARGEAAAER
eukprot:CAMPEP_0168386018 /NCGR_PEP_ID=MMETSP0228-20121227/15212_1 /TAXON_ID=133427 /ORGANISM="Protoceratium reticulatum, Strain CCCM 535 (=CCMP 1889)" /LENGTH=289 /DNA_ID=CAMNT_0008399207 /DNA_START=134 /DNA_END=1003 /DNA_ORIENTATION=-